MIVVSAATGEFGRLVVDQLLNRVPTSDVAAAVRDVHKAADLADRGAQLRHGDYEEPDILRDSFSGADRLLFISAPSSDSGERKRQHHTVADAARTSGVGHLLYTSGLGANVGNEGGLADHHYSGGSSIQVCGSRLRPVSLRAAAGQRECGSPSRPRRGRRSRADWPNQLGGSYDFTGRRWTFDELAQVLSDISGRTITHREVDEDEGTMTMIGPAVRAGIFEHQTDDLERVLGHSSGARGRIPTSAPRLQRGLAL